MRQVNKGFWPLLIPTLVMVGSTLLSLGIWQWHREMQPGYYFVTESRWGSKSVTHSWTQSPHDDGEFWIESALEQAEDDDNREEGIPKGHTIITFFAPMPKGRIDGFRNLKQERRRWQSF